MINSVSNPLEIYYSKLPSHCLEAAVISSLFSFCISVLITGRIDAGKTSAIFAATVSLVSALTVPIFSQLSASRNELVFGAKLLANLGITQLLINSWTRQRVNFISSSILTILFSFLYTHYYGEGVYRSQTVILSPPF